MQEFFYPLKKVYILSESHVPLHFRDILYGFDEICLCFLDSFPLTVYTQLWTKRHMASFLFFPDDIIENTFHDKFFSA